MSCSLKNELNIDRIKVWQLYGEYKLDRRKDYPRIDMTIKN